MNKGNILPRLVVLLILIVSLLDSSCSKDEPENVIADSTWKVLMDESGVPPFNEGSLITFDKIGIVKFYREGEQNFGEWLFFNDTLRIIDGLGEEAKLRIEGPIKIAGKKATWEYSTYKCKHCDKPLKISTMILEKY